MIQSNWHTHTYRCGHAKGTDEEYVLAAIQAGLTTLGFSDHAAYPDQVIGERMNINQLDDYIQSIRHLQEKYQDQIQIYLGIELECYKDQWDILSYYRKNLDYCILGQHCLDYNRNESSYHLSRPDQLERYVDLIEYACQHHLADYIAHPDVCLWSYPRIDDTVKHIAKRLADISIKYDTPLELNCGSGVKYGFHTYEDGERYAYPTTTFFEEFAKKQCPIIIGLDVHDPKTFLTDVYLDRALDIVKGLNLNIIKNYPLQEKAKQNKALFY